MTSLPTLTLISHVVPPILAMVLKRAIALVGIRTSGSGRIICVGLDMLLQVLGTLERLATEIASMRLQRNVDADVRGDVVAFDDGNLAVGPTTGQVEVIGTLATDMPLANVILRRARC